MDLNERISFPMTEQGAQECAAMLETLPSGYLNDKARLRDIQKNLCVLIPHLAAHYGGAVSTFSVTAAKRLGKMHIYITYAGAKYDPRITSGDNDEYSGVTDDVMSKYSLFTADHHYSDGVNILHTVIGHKQRIDSFHRILLAVFLGVMLGLAGKTFDSETRYAFIEILSLLKATILDLIMMSSSLTVFTMVVNSISGFKSVESVKKTGLGILKYHVVNYAMALLCVFIFAFRGLRFAASEGGGGVISSITEFASLFTDMLPSDYLSPLVNCNFLHIIIIAFLIGFAMLSVGKSAQPLSELFRSAEVVSSRIMSWFSNLIPLFLFAMTPTLMWSDSLSLISGVLMYMLAILSAIFISAFVFFMYMCLKAKLPIAASFKKILPAMLRGFLTANSALSVPEIQAAAKRFGVKDSFNGYATAVGFIFSHVGIMIMELVLVFGMMPAAGIAVTVPSIIRIVIAAILFSLAVPPTSGGNIAIISILFEMVGIADSYLALVAPVMIIADFFETATRCGEIVMGTVLAANKMDTLNRG